MSAISATPASSANGGSAVLEALIAQPEDVEAGLVPRDQLVVGDAAEPLGLLPLPSVAGLVAGDEVVEVGPAERVGLEREVLVGSQVVDPQVRRPGGVGAGLAVEEQHVCLDALGVEDAGRQAQQGVDVTFVQQPAADRLPGPALEQHVVGHDHRRPTMRSQQHLDVLHDVELIVRRGRPEVVPHDRERLALGLALGVDDLDRRLLPEWRVGEHHVEPDAGVGPQRVVDVDRTVGVGRFDAVQQPAADGLARATFEQDVVGYDDRSCPLDRQEGLDVLDEVELLVGRRRPEVLTHDREGLALGLPLGVDDLDR
jgi:hypothetical protein